MIDLRSDTVTRPDDAMREAARHADVGDDVYGEDPTVNELESRVAELLGTEDALFVPSGTMGNQVAVRTHTDRGEEIVCERECHLYKWEVAGVVEHATVQPRPIEGDERGVLDEAQVRSATYPGDGHRPATGLLALENTHNSRGGTAIAPSAIREAAAAAHDADVPVHLDGARLFNAAVAQGVPARSFVDPVDSVMVCLSKGLGAPVGSMLAGSEDFIDRAHRIRKLLGGGMRQAGIIAAPGLRALDNRERLAEDHRRAARLAAGLERIDGLGVTPPETNIVIASVEGDAERFLEACRAEGVLGVPFDDRTIRFCTHLDIDDEDIETAIRAIAAA